MVMNDSIEIVRLIDGDEHVGWAVGTQPFGSTQTTYCHRYLLCALWGWLWMNDSSKNGNG